MAQNRALKEISRDVFWKLEDKLKNGQLVLPGGPYQVKYSGDDRSYTNNLGTWLKSDRGVYYAHHSIANK